MSSLVPRKSLEATFSQPMKTNTGNQYPAIVVDPVAGGRFAIRDGHHRYYILLDGSYHGLVPVIRREKKLPGTPFYI
jgi:hypothetical protein